MRTLSGLGWRWSLLVALLALALLVAAAVTGFRIEEPFAATAKPWMWKPARMNARLMAGQPFKGDAGVFSAACKGVGKGAVGRFSRFTCRVGWGGPPNLATQYVTVAVRVLPVGSGRFCFPVDAAGRTAPGGMTPSDGRACPA